jgi:hypothetical protein
MIDPMQIARVLIIVVVTIWIVRIYSYVRARQRRGWRDFLDFLSIGLLSPYLAYSPHRYESHRRPLAPEILRLALAILVIPAAWIAAQYFAAFPASQHSWWLNHLIDVVGFTVIMTAVGQAHVAIWRIRGIRASVLVDKIYLSRTPADFWRRWSWPMHLWLHRHVYLPSGGRRHHVRAVAMVFFVSGALHELMAYIAIGHFTGHQMLYFSASALGVLASPMLERLGSLGLPGLIMMRALTLLYLASTAAFMFITLNYFIPLYWRHIWLMW